MKVKYYLVGLAMLAMPAQVEAWGFFSSIVNWVAQIFSPPPAPAPTPAPTPKPTPKPVLSKTIVMRANIVPSWEDLAPSGAAKIKLGRVADYWSELLASDLKTYQTTKCLNTHSLTTPNTPEVFKALIDNVRVCLSKSIIPTFVVADTNMVTPALPMYVPANHLDPDDYTPPPIEAPTLPPTLAPTPVVTSAPLVSDPDPISLDSWTVKTTDPWIFDEPGAIQPTVPDPPKPMLQNDFDMPGKNGAGIPPLMVPPGYGFDGVGIPPREVVTMPPMIKEPEPAVPNWAHKAEVNPRAAAMPDFRTLDTDNDGHMTSEEMVGYVENLGAKALETASKADDQHGLSLLHKIIAHHYNQLTKCVTSVTSKTTEKAMDAAEFQALAPSIDASCNVKFRYSLLAGPPPFEWVAGHRPTVTAEHVSKWFANELQKANKESTLVPPEVAGAAHCIGDSLEANRYASIDRTKFYSTIKTCY